MRFLEALVTAWVWACICLVITAKGTSISQDIIFLSFSIVIAGALAGKD